MFLASLGKLRPETVGQRGLQVRPSPDRQPLYTHTHTHTKMQSSYISGLRGCVQYIPGLNPLRPPTQSVVHPTPTWSDISNLVEQCLYLLCAIGFDLDCDGKNTTLLSSTKCAMLWFSQTIYGDQVSVFCYFFVVTEFTISFSLLVFTEKQVIIIITINMLLSGPGQDPLWVASREVCRWSTSQSLALELLLIWFE